MAKPNRIVKVVKSSGLAKVESHEGGVFLDFYGFPTTTDATRVVMLAADGETMLAGLRELVQKLEVALAAPPHDGVESVH